MRQLVISLRLRSRRFICLLETDLEERAGPSFLPPPPFHLPQRLLMCLRVAKTTKPKHRWILYPPFAFVFVVFVPRHSRGGQQLSKGRKGELESTSTFVLFLPFLLPPSSSHLLPPSHLSQLSLAPSPLISTALPSVPPLLSYLFIFPLPRLGRSTTSSPLSSSSWEDSRSASVE